MRGKHYPPQKCHHRHEQSAQNHDRRWWNCEMDCMECLLIVVPCNPYKPFHGSTNYGQSRLHTHQWCRFWEVDNAHLCDMYPVMYLGRIGFFQISISFSHIVSVSSNYGYDADLKAGLDKWWANDLTIGHLVNPSVKSEMIKGCITHCVHFKLRCLQQLINAIMDALAVLGYVIAGDRNSWGQLLSREKQKEHFHFVQGRWRS